jgi:hypothetical protein
MIISSIVFILCLLLYRLIRILRRNKKLWRPLHKPQIFLGAI